MGIVTIPCTFDTANRKKDKSVRLAFTTNLEISTPDFAEMDLLVGSEGWLLWKSNEVDISEIPEEDAPSREGKPKIQRLRGAYYIYWRDHTDQSEPFETYWNRCFEKLMENIKGKLD